MKETDYMIIQGNCLEEMDKIYEEKGNLLTLFSNPPYFLSNGGITCKNGKTVNVDKGDWDKSKGADLNHEFNHEWIKGVNIKAKRFNDGIRYTSCNLLNWVCYATIKYENSQ